MTVRFGGCLRIGMVLGAADFKGCHKEAALVHAARALVFGQDFKQLATVRHLLRIVALGADALKHQTRHVPGGVSAYSAVPTVIMPGNANRDVAKGEHCLILDVVRSMTDSHLWSVVSLEQRWLLFPQQPHAFEPNPHGFCGNLELVRQRPAAMLQHHVVSSSVAGLEAAAP